MTERTAKDDICTPANTRRVGSIVIGSMAGQFVVPDDFDDPLDDELLDLFEGKDDVKPTDKGS